MFVAGFVGFSGSGKTTLIESLLGEFAARGLRVSVIKHAHHGFELDREGKDSWRHRQAGACEVLVASPYLLALQRPTREPTEYEIGDLLRRLDAVDWVFVEGYKHAPIAKVEVWRSTSGKPRSLPDDPSVLALASDVVPPGGMPGAVRHLELARPDAIAAWLIEQRGRFAWRAGAR